MQMIRSKQSLHFLDKLKGKLNLHSESQETCSCCMRFYRRTARMLVYKRTFRLLLLMDIFGTYFTWMKVP